MSTREPTTADSTPEQVGLAFLHLAHGLREQVDQDMAAAGLSLSRTKVLQVLASRGALHQAELAEALDRAPRSVTQIVESLERLGMVVRRDDPRDRRRKTVSLTGAGRTALAAAERAGAHTLRRLFGSLGPRRLADAEALLDHLHGELAR
ncbi:MarR family winged helix-turn-helix transcriptional regulator [uncultured Streptomyces sp.]|uniref:MarR family winged helix-turn-helix transcriptional regulator n=1 Tax=uncultured Streptomyces sp. TaxID=174707 RepID=UPI002617E022|nr:MarR family winged helix-turn-helix transcriptional regulator [uncultured Streptomyces sp.]